VDLEAVTTTKTVDPGSQAVFTVKVKNTGNGDDTFQVDKSGTHSNWAQLSATDISLKAEETRDITLSVAVPSGTSSDESARITVTATSKGSASSADEILLVVNVKQKTGVEVSAKVTRITLKQGDQQTISFYVTNKGNGDDTFDLKATGTTASWVKFSPTKLSLDPQARKDSKVTIKVPSDAAAQEHTVTLTAKSAAGGDQASVTITVEVEKKDDGGFEIPGFTHAAMLLAIMVALFVTVFYRRKN
jgi:uncharacterized membrane protein